MTWFEALTGFCERSPSHVRQNITVHGEVLTSRANARSMVFGRLETPSLGDLRQRVGSAHPAGGKMTVRELVADARALHRDVGNAGALFQVASQFNLLEMASPDVTPEQGIGIYESDPTQGPACAIAAGAGTIYRNYFAPVNGQTGQAEGNQIDCLADLGNALGNAGNRLWQMRNGYALASRGGLDAISNRIRRSSEDELDELRKLLRIGIQWGAQVTLDECTHTVSQAYCSALPVAYGGHPAECWTDFARLVLDAAYEATICAAIVNSRSTGSNRAFLTLLGGGAFGNERRWIVQSIGRALRLYGAWDIDVAIVSHRASNADVRQLVGQLRRPA